MGAALLKGNMVMSVRVTRTDALGPKVALPGIYPADILYLQRCVCVRISVMALFIMTKYWKPDEGPSVGAIEMNDSNGMMESVRAILWLLPWNPFPVASSYSFVCVDPSPISRDGPNWWKLISPP